MFKVDFKRYIFYKIMFIIFVSESKINYIYFNILKYWLVK